MTRRIIRQLLASSLIAFHAALTLCGPCLHELPGLGHDSTLVSTSKQSHAPLKSPHDTADTCPICHFLAQGHSPVSVSCELPAPHAGAWTAPISSPIKIVTADRPSRQRAPPIVAS